MKQKDEKDYSICDNCGERYEDGDLITPPEDFWARGTPGYMIPSGECPDEKCGAFCYPDNAHTREVQAAPELLAEVESEAEDIEAMLSGRKTFSPEGARNHLFKIRALIFRVKEGK